MAAPGSSGRRPAGGGGRATSRAGGAARAAADAAGRARRALDRHRERVTRGAGDGARTLALAPGPVERARITLDGPAADLGGTLYTPEGLPPGSPLLVYYHGGGWVLGSVRTHDDLCAYLARRARVRVLSVEYRLAPEHPFPAPVEDAFAAFDFAVADAGSWGADPGAVAVGGDSAEANLAAVVAASAIRRPVFALLFYPRVDFATRRPSHELFKAGLGGRFLEAVAEAADARRVGVAPESG